MCGGGSKGSSGPSEAEIRAREATAAANARAQVLAEQQQLAKKTNDEAIAAKISSANAESQALAIQRQAIDATAMAEKKRNDDVVAGKKYAAESEASSYEKQKSLLSSLSDEENEQQRKLRAQAQKRTLLGG